MTISLDTLDNRKANARRFSSLDSPLLKRVVNEYPVGYVAQLARPFSARSAGRSRLAPKERRAAATNFSPPDR